jgi:hypothetical protein
VGLRKTANAARGRFSSGCAAPLDGGDSPADPAIDGSENPEGLWFAIVPVVDHLTITADNLTIVVGGPHSSANSLLSKSLIVWTMANRSFDFTSASRGQSHLQVKASRLLA